MRRGSAAVKEEEDEEVRRSHEEWDNDNQLSAKTSEGWKGAVYFFLWELNDAATTMRGTHRNVPERLRNCPGGFFFMPIKGKSLHATSPVKLEGGRNNKNNNNNNNNNSSSSAPTNNHAPKNSKERPNYYSSVFLFLLLFLSLFVLNN